MREYLSGIADALTLSPCRVHFRTRGGVFGFTLIEDWEYKIKDLRPEENTPETLPDKVLGD